MNEIEKIELDIEYDERQFILMIQKIRAFKKGELYLSTLIGELIGLLNALILPEEEWKETFRSYCLELDVLYSVAIDFGETHLDSDDQKTVLAAIENLEKMVKIKFCESPITIISNCIWKI